jgi:hypothetical protein
MLDAGGSELASLSLVQQISPLNAQLEALIAEAVDKSGPGVGNIDALRQMVNDHNPYYLNITLNAPEPDEQFKKFLFSTVYAGILKQPPDKRAYRLDQVANALNSDDTDFVTAVASGLGVANIRLALAAMLLPPVIIPFTELPQPNYENEAADEHLRQQLAATSEADRIDLFNLVRFPKSNISLCSKLLEALRDKFFSSVKFDDVLTKMSGTMADWIIINYHKGPLHRN